MRRLSFIILLLMAFATRILGQSPHGKGFNMECASCHTTKNWQISASDSKFDHNTTDFKLTGKHTVADCKSCHSNLQFKNAKSDCAACHQDVHQQTVGTNCERCHSTNNWLVSNITGLHEKTSFPLSGVHATVDCKSCHKTNNNVNFGPVGLTCAECHTRDFRATTRPNHSKLGLSNDCVQCHTATPEWKTRTFPDHDLIYPLTGAHASIAQDCEKCHPGGNYANTPKDCVGCHNKDFAGTSNPNHTKTGISTDCASCHTTAPGWKPAKYTDHDIKYPLTGGHAFIANDCAKCHNGNYNQTPNDCNACHSKNYNATVDPDHKKLGFSQDCASCHTTSPGWYPALFKDHDQFYPLTGGHKIVSCNQCHKDGAYRNTPNDCASCHTNNYQAAKNPDHKKLNLSNDCATCHTTSPGWRPAKFTEHDNYFPLIGGHKNVQCNECHKNGIYEGTSKECNNCHNKDYVASKSPNHTLMGLSTDCASCHTPNPGWRPSTFDHNKFYVLEGAHASINDCSKCHDKGDVKSTPTDCNSCHNKDYKASKNPNHEQIGMGTDCASCHNTTPGWRPSSFNHDQYWQLTGAHKNVSDCTKCHNNGNVKNTPTDCNSCHNASFKSASNPNHTDAGFSMDCASCHTTNPGWRPSNFNHGQYWPLTGAHASVSSCTKCHTSGSYQTTSADCNSCHAANYNATTNPNHKVMGMGTDCASCHTTNPDWRPSTFNHDQYWQLTGAHKNVSDCTKCHNNGNVKNTPTDCNSCHNASFKSASNPNHTDAGFSTDCASCHTTNPGWRPTNFNHGQYWPLTGAHASVSSCTKCHTSGSYQTTSADCNSCHTANYNATTNPNHKVMGMGTECASCHTTNPGWLPSTFNHDQYWQLTGAHKNVSDCTKCHNNGDVKNTPTDCNSCHNANFKAATNPNHVSAGFSTDCATCHTTNPGWRPSTFNHNNYWPLTGAHANVSNCTSCHVGGNFNNTPTDCNACHNANYQSAASPNHKQLGMGTDCASCHTTNPGWRPSTFNHNSYWALTGAHASVSNCASCHTTGDVKTTPSDCNSCHNSNYRSTSNPNHTAAGLSTDCASCHSTNPGWKPTSFSHNQYWALTGAHTSVSSCVACHTGNAYSTTSSDCNACHNANYTAATNPNHVNSGFSTDCASCHTTNPSWRPSTFNHNNYWALTGAHASVACTQCHIGGNYNNTPTDCNSCHNSNYRAASNPNHVNSGFSTDCASCHTTNPGWRPSTFNHNNFYPLVGAHAGIANSCTKCHAGGNFNNTPNTCYGCHSSDYNNASPNHASSKFPTDCTGCHSQNAWKPATWDHDNSYFPIYSGEHKGKWSSCTDCHTNASNYQVFSCFKCHGKSETDKDHKGVRNYSYDSIACLSCHPKGKD
ncbi:MAG: hypothetical protein LCH67_01575 [Bacteroidetes bacterium]|nr:hypothetical protein [Bacteroidota bacterium]